MRTRSLTSVLLAILCTGVSSQGFSQQNGVQNRTHLSCATEAAAAKISAEQFFRAILQNDAATVCEALLGGFDPNQVDPFGNTGLHWAAARNNRQIVSLLIESGANLEVSSASAGATPLVFAVDQDAADAVATLLEAGAQTSVSVTTQIRGEKVVQSLIDIAARHNRLDIVQMLADDGEPIAEANSRALQSAIRNSNAPLVAFLLDKGAQHPDLAATARFPLLDEVAQRTGRWGRELNSADVEIFETLIAHGARTLSPTNTLSIVARTGNMRLLRAALEPQPPLNQYDDTGETPLMSAARSGNREAVEELLSRGAAPAMMAKQTYEPLVSEAPLRDLDRARTALSMAAGAGSAAIVRRLAELPGFTCDMFGAGMMQAAMIAGEKAVPVMETLVERKECFPRGAQSLSSALLRAVRKQEMGTVNLLLWKGATTTPLIDPNFSSPVTERSPRPGAGNSWLKWNFNVVGFYPMGPLEVAIANRNVQLAQLMVDAGASLTGDLRDTSALHVLASPDLRLRADAEPQADSIPMLHWLLDRGAPINAQDAFGYTPLMIAVQGGETRLVDALLKAGADPKVKSMDSLDAATLAEQAKRPGTKRLVQGQCTVDEALALDAKSLTPFAVKQTPLSKAVCITLPDARSGFANGRNGVEATQSRLPITPFAGFLSVDISLDPPFQYGAGSTRATLVNQVLEALATWRLVCANCAPWNLAVAHVDGQAYMIEECYREIRDLPNQKRRGPGIPQAGDATTLWGSDAMARCHARFSAGRIVAGNDVRGYVPLHPDNSVWKIACEATKYREVAVALGCGASADRASASLLVAKVAVSFTFEDTRCAGDKHRIVACTNAHRGVTLNARDFNFQLPGKPEHYGNGRIQADLSLVLLHEVGHWLGLKHPTDGTKSIMSADLKDVTCISNDNVAMLLDPLQQALSLQSQSLEALIYTGPR